MMTKMDSWTDNVGNTVVYDTDVPKNLYLKLEGSDKYLTLRVDSFGGTTICHRLSYHNPHNSTEFNGEVYYRDGNVYRDHNSLCFAPKFEDPIIFHEMKRIELDPASIVPLPTIRVKEYLLCNSSGTFIYTSYDKFQIDPHKFFIGEYNNMKPVEILSFDRYRDGGTTYIETSNGTLFVPTPWEKNDKAIKFEEERFFEFDWEVEEGDNSASLKLESALSFLERFREFKLRINELLENNKG
jgi:hypothetical protein